MHIDKNTYTNWEFIKQKLQLFDYISVMTMVENVGHVQEDKD